MKTLLSLLLSASLCSAGDLTTSVLDSGGGRTTAADVTHDGSLGGITGTSGVVRQGYVAQLYDIKSLEVSASPETVDEDGTRQLAADLVLDDDTTLAATPTDFTWSITAGPLSIDTTGLASGQAVYQDTTATAQATLGSATGTLDLTVLDILPDNFGTYAGDGIDDDWQVSFFGLDNPSAAPALDPDGDTQDNLFEFLALVDPTDPLSFFCAELSASNAVTFSPISPLRTYALLASPDLNPANFVPVASTASDNAGERTATDTSPAGGARRFYKIEISDQ